MAHSGREGPKESGQFQGLPDPFESFTSLHKELLAGWNISIAEETITELPVIPAFRRLKQDN